MKNFLKWTVIIVISLVILFTAFFQYMKYQTKKASPEVEVEFVQDDLSIKLFYSSPSKKGRAIFGSLVPFNEVWRTGANEPTTFETSSDLKIMGKDLKAGKYTLWTIPSEDSWQVIWNEKMYGWGVNFDAVASREADHDALTVEVNTQKDDVISEQLVIDVIEGTPPTLLIKWDDTYIEVPMN